MARPEGFEPPAPRFVVWCSIQLSYGRLGVGDIGASAGVRKPRMRAFARLPGGAAKHRERRMIRARFPVPLAAAIALAAGLAGGCAAREGAFPSLAMRAAELEGSIEAPTRPPPAATPSDPALLQRIAALDAQGEAGARAFEAAYAGAAEAVDRAGASGSDSWVEAQVAVSRLAAAEASAAGALADLHQLALDRETQPTATADRAAIAAAIDRLSARVAGHGARLAALTERLNAR